MSLLMKALEKAAKDRTEANGDPPLPVEPATATAPVTAKEVPELTLEPVAAARAPEPSPAAPPPRTPAGPGRQRPAAPAAKPAVARESAQAAAMIRAAQADEKPGVISYLRDRPLIAFGSLAGLFLIGFGAYVYVEIMNPSLFAAKPPPRPAQIAQTPAPVPPAPGTNPATPVPTAAAVTPPAPAQPLTSLLPPPSEPVAAKEKSAAVTAQAPSAATPPRNREVAPAPVLAPAAPIAAATPAMPRDSIKIVAANQAPAINPMLSDAYSALNSGNLETSQKLYSQLLKSDPRNTEALLGLAAIATQQGDRDAATKHYVKVIELDPRNSLAQAGLLSVLGGADPTSAETRIKQLIARDPNSAFLHFTLGNAYIDQSRWPDAQQAFFQAHHLQPDNPDYAFNLAIALEHIGQQKPALEYYRRAIQLAAAKGHSNFSADAVKARVSKLEKVVQ